jgi:hypothetical protein
MFKFSSKFPLMKSVSISRLKEERFNFWMSHRVTLKLELSTTSEKFSIKYTQGICEWPRATNLALKDSSLFSLKNYLSLISFLSSRSASLDIIVHKMHFHVIQFVALESLHSFFSLCLYQNRLLQTYIGRCF